MHVEADETSWGIRKGDGNCNWTKRTELPIRIEKDNTYNEAASMNT